MAYTVKKVADLSGLTVRTLHHYDDIGLLKPAAVSRAGYRLYDDEDLARLQEILLFRELGFDLKEIKAIVSRFGYNREAALHIARRLLEEENRWLEELLVEVDKSLAAPETGQPGESRALFVSLDKTALAEEKKEARRRFPPAGKAL